jgi:cell division septum initiation protein DivIVA
MTKRVSICLEDSVLEFLDKITNNRSAYINELVAQQQQMNLERELEAAYKEQAEDPQFQLEIKAWDCTVGDGID